MLLRKRFAGIVFISATLILFASCASSAGQATSASLCAAEAEPDIPEHPPEGTTPPEVVSRVAPQAPNRLLGRKVTAKVEAIIGEDGTPRNVCAVSGDPDWGAALAAAVRQWRFRPATANGKPIAVRFFLEAHFNG